MKMFENEADKIFELAGVIKTEKNKDLWQQCVQIMSQKMASVSHMGLNNKRVTLYNKQRDTLVEDLKKYKSEGLV